ncbi:MAG: hypothetical protein Q8Q09_23185 [Deltaproteobacteria bacterium]|nr:hypothetical protein [Deltaproteobacteria bacterium]
MPRVVVASARIQAALSAIALSALSGIASAQTAAPKVCLVVARDPDRAVLALVARAQQMIDARADLRTIGDPVTRGALVGETLADPAMAPAVSARRALRFDPSDAPALLQLSEPLACTQIIVFSAISQGFAADRFDPAARSFAPRVEHAAWSDPELAALWTAAPPAVSVASVASVGSVTTSATPATPVVAPRPGPRVTAAATAPPDPRLTTASAPPRPSGPPLWAWIVGGGAGVALIAGFLIAQNAGPSVPLLRIAGPGAGP